MKLYTIKDLLNYAAPCYWCGQNCNLFLSSEQHNKFRLIDFENDILTFESANGTFTFNIVGNQFKTNNLRLIKDYKYKFHLYCKCGLNHVSEIITFNTSNKINYIEPFEISVRWDSYTSNSHISYIGVTEKNGEVEIVNSERKIKIKMSEKSLRDFKNKEALLERIKIYLLFS